MNEYTKQGIDFLIKTKTKFNVIFVKHEYHFLGDTEKRDVFKVTFKRDKKQFSLNFGQSLNKSNMYGSNMPNVYDILACLQKYEVGSFDEFCSEFGYNDCKLSEYSRVKKIYNNTKKEFSNVCKIWDKFEIEILQDIN